MWAWRRVAGTLFKPPCVLANVRGHWGGLRVAITSQSPGLQVACGCLRTPSVHQSYKIRTRSVQDPYAIRTQSVLHPYTMLAGYALACVTLSSRAPCAH